MQALDVLAYGSLQQDVEEGKAGLHRTSQAQEVRVADLLSQLSIPAARVQMVMVNHRPATIDALVRPGDRVCLFPKEYPIFPDWNGYRYV